MITIQPSLTTGDIITLVGLILVPIGLTFWGLHREQHRRHAENLEKFRQLIGDRMYHPPHSHNEKNGALYAEGISTSPLKLNGGK